MHLKLYGQNEAPRTPWAWLSRVLYKWWSITIPSMRLGGVWNGFQEDTLMVNYILISIKLSARSNSMWSHLSSYWNLVLFSQLSISSGDILSNLIALDELNSKRGRLIHGFWLETTVISCSLAPCHDSENPINLKKKI
jgi:hypothetical protein